MTVERGVAWGAPGPLPEGSVVVEGDAEVGELLEARRRAHEDLPTVGLAGGDLCRTLGGRGDRRRLEAGDVTLATVDSTTTLENTPTWSQLGGFLEGMVDIALLRVEPNFTGVLPMYVAFLLWAIPLVALLKRGLWWAAAGASIAVYAIGKLVGGFTFAAWEGSFDVLGWQLLFSAGLLFGWAWEHERLAIPEVWRRRIVSGGSSASTTPRPAISRSPNRPCRSDWGCRACASLSIAPTARATRSRPPRSTN